MKQQEQLYIGTSNVVIPGNKTTFPEHYRERSRLQYYASLFNTVEINSSFYKLPMPATFGKWATEVPEDFRFAIKVSKEITHSKDLVTELSYIDRFMAAAKNTGSKKGPLLIQFPGKISLDHFTRVEEILQRFMELDKDNEWKKAVEFRNSSWYTGETYEMLHEFGAAMVLHDIPKGKLTALATNADFIYQRFHGPTAGNYRDSYPDTFLKEKARQIKDWLSEGKQVYVYFNNTIGDAFNNAVSLQHYCAK